LAGYIGRACFFEATRGSISRAQQGVYPGWWRCLVVVATWGRRTDGTEAFCLWAGFLDRARSWIFMFSPLKKRHPVMSFFFGDSMVREPSEQQMADIEGWEPMGPIPGKGENSRAQQEWRRRSKGVVDWVFNQTACVWGWTRNPSAFWKAIAAAWPSLWSVLETRVRITCGPYFLPEAVGNERLLRSCLMRASGSGSSAGPHRERGIGLRCTDEYTVDGWSGVHLAPCQQRSPLRTRSGSGCLHRPLGW
jgi:hypothetical protein